MNFKYQLGTIKIKFNVRELVLQLPMWNLIQIILKRKAV